MTPLKLMNRKTCFTMVVMFALLYAGVAWAGDLDPAAGPADIGSSMYTLEDIYKRLNDGTAGSKQTFTEPTAGPTTGTMHILNDIMDIAPSVDDTNGAKANQALSGKKFWELTTAGWGLQTGTAPVVYTCDCSGCFLSPLGRWCDNNNGTVRDMSTGLLRLKDAGWGDQYQFWVFTGNPSDTNAHDRAAQVKASTPATLTDGSAEGDWRLPTIKELNDITTATGTEFIRSSSMYWFTNVQGGRYWSSSSHDDVPTSAYCIQMSSGALISIGKTYSYYV